MHKKKLRKRTERNSGNEPRNPTDSRNILPLLCHNSAIPCLIKVKLPAIRGRSDNKAACKNESGNSLRSGARIWTGRRTCNIPKDKLRNLPGIGGRIDTRPGLSYPQSQREALIGWFAF